MTPAGIVTVTGWAQGRGSLQPLAAAIAPHRAPTLTAPADFLPSAGAASGPEPSAPPAEFLARRIGAGGEPVVLLGWSLGALIALETAIRAPQLVTALVLVGATARFCRAPGYPAGMPPRLVEAMIARLAVSPEAVIADFFRRAHLPGEIDARDLRNAEAAALRQGSASLTRGLRHLLATDLRAELPGIACPTLILHGEEDRIVPVGAAAVLHQGLAESRLETFPGAGHALPLRSVALIGGRISDFLRDL